MLFCSDFFTPAKSRQRAQRSIECTLTPSMPVIAKRQHLPQIRTGGEPLAVVSLTTQLVDLAVLLIIAHDFDPAVDVGLQDLADLGRILGSILGLWDPSHIDQRSHGRDGEQVGLWIVLDFDHGLGKYLWRNSSEP